MWRIKLNTTEISGTFALDLDFGAQYLLKFAKEGFVTKSIAVDTRIPAGIDAKSDLIEFEVELYAKTEGVDVEMFNNPVGKIKYNPKSPSLRTLIGTHKRADKYISGKSGSGQKPLNNRPDMKLSADSPYPKIRPRRTKKLKSQ